MKKTITACIITLFTGLILLFSNLQNACAEPLSIALSTDEEGLSLNYSLPFLGPQQVQLETDNDTDTILINFFIFEIARIDLTHKGFSEEDSILDALNVELTMSFLFGLIPFDPVEVPVPFGDYAVEIDLFATERKDLIGDEDIGISLLLAPDDYEHEVIASLPIIEPIDETGAGSEFTISIEPAAAQTFDGFDLDFSLSTFWFLTRIDVRKGDNETEILSIPLPNGAYFVSLDAPEV